MNLLSVFTGPYALLAKWGVILALGIALFGTGWVKGNQHGTEKLTRYIGEQAIAAVKIAKAQVILTEKIRYKYITKQAEAKVVTKYIDREVTKYAESNTGVCLDPEFRRLHDAAALGIVPAATSGTDAAPGAAETLATVKDNYAKANTAIERLIFLQEWVDKQRQLNTKD